MKYELVKEADRYRVRALKDFGNVKAGELGGLVSGYHNLSQEGYCWIFDDSTVSKDARVEDDAVVGKSSLLTDKAAAKGWCRIENSGLSNNTLVHGYAVVQDSTLCGGTKVLDESTVTGSYLLGTVQMRGHSSAFRSRLDGNVEVLNGVAVTSVLEGNIKVTGVSLKNAVMRRDALVSHQRDYLVFQNVGTENGTLTAYLTGAGEILLTRGCFTGTVEEFERLSKLRHGDDMQKQYALLLQMIQMRLGEQIALRKSTEV